MADLTLPNTIDANTTADAAEVQQNFAVTQAFVNNDLINRDGTVAMAAPLLLVGTPVADNQAATKAYVDAVLPVGVILMYGGLVAPAGLWAIANGASLSRATYPQLYSVYEYRFGGSGDNFLLPNLAARVPIGVDSTQARFDTPGKIGGSYAVTIATHTHPINHDHPSQATGGGGAHSHTVPAHVHPMNHDHAQATSSLAGQHFHEPSTGTGFYAYSSGGTTGDTESIINATVATLDARGAPSTNSAPAHSHTVNLAAYTGSTGSSSAFSTDTEVAHVHTFDVSNYTGTSGVPNGTLGTEQIPPFVVLQYIVRLD
jgi:microcystin-dependent protein